MEDCIDGASILGTGIVGFEGQFSEDNINSYCEDTIQYIINMFSSSLNVKLNEDTEELINENNLQAKSNSVATGNDKENESDDDDANDKLLQQFLLLEKMTNSIGNVSNTSEQLMEELENKIRKVFETYKNDCSSIQLLDYLMMCGNDEYKRLIHNGELDVDKLCKIIDLEYITKISDVTIFWKNN
jgi:hypothetical protein